MRHFVGMRKQKDYRAFNGRSPLQLLEHLGPDGPSVSQLVSLLVSQLINQFYIAYWH